MTEGVISSVERIKFESMKLALLRGFAPLSPEGKWRKIQLMRAFTPRRTGETSTASFAFFVCTKVEMDELVEKSFFTGLLKNTLC